jgi:hypothetical protein
VSPGLWNATDLLPGANRQHIPSGLGNDSQSEELAIGGTSTRSCAWAKASPSRAGRCNRGMAANCDDFRRSGNHGPAKIQERP